MTAKLFIPEIDETRLRELAQRIKPVYHTKGWSGLTYMQPCDLRGVSFVWSPQPNGRAMNLEEVCTIRTLHTYGYYGFFKPSIAEVLAQIPMALLREVVAFKIKGPNDLRKEADALNAGFHVAQTTLYRRRQNP